MILEFFVLSLVICSTLLIVGWLFWRNQIDFLDRPIIDEFKAFYDYIGPPFIEWLGVVLVIFILYLGSFNDNVDGGGGGGE